jgi:hypothetical protein
MERLGPRAIAAADNPGSISGCECGAAKPTNRSEASAEEAGQPYIFIRDGPRLIGFVETKPPKTDLPRVLRSEQQLKRYRQLLPNRILTDYSRFLTIREGDNEIEEDDPELLVNGFIPLDATQSHGMSRNALRACDTTQALAAKASYTIAALGTLPGGNASYASAINKSGQVVGAAYIQVGGTNTPHHRFRLYSFSLASLAPWLSSHDWTGCLLFRGRLINRRLSRPSGDPSSTSDNITYYLTA